MIHHLGILIISGLIFGYWFIHLYDAGSWLSFVILIFPTQQSVFIESPPNQPVPYRDQKRALLSR